MKSKTSIRDFQPNDVERLLTYREETARISFPELRLDRKHSRKSILLHSRRFPGTIKLACLNSKLIGFIMFQPRKGSLGTYGYINGIFVENLYRKQGVGALLLKEAEKLYELLLRAGSAAIVERWAAASSFARGKAVRVLTTSGEYRAETAGLEPSGALRVRRSDGRDELLVAGEIVEVK
jgi:GNAT superfamily N-acetyltransferase